MSQQIILKNGEELHIGNPELIKDSKVLEAIVEEMNQTITKMSTINAITQADEMDELYEKYQAQKTHIQGGSSYCNNDDGECLSCGS